MVTTNNNYLAKSGSKIVIYGRQQKQASIILQCDFRFVTKIQVKNKCFLFHV